MRHVYVNYIKWVNLMKNNKQGKLYIRFFKL